MKESKRRIVILLGCLVALGLLQAGLSRESSGADLILAEGGQSPYQIVVAAEAIASENYAAEELSSYLERITGVKVPIVPESSQRMETEIVIGPGAIPVDLLGQVDTGKPGPDGYILKTIGQRLLIAGVRPRGTLNGVYAFLEEKLGVRWFTPELEVVPPRQRLAVAAMDESYTPAFEYREVYWREMMRNADFAARHRLNGDHLGLGEKHGSAAVVYFPFVHSFDMLVPPELFAEHPEYFPLIDGQRKGGYVQRCLSNPEVIRIATERVKDWIKEHPDATVISISQNDTHNQCQCPECLTFDEQEGSPSASLIRFVNRIAEAIAPGHPNLRFDTLAYQYTRKPPRTLRPHPSVIIRLCSIECCFAHGLESCPAPENKRFVEDIVAWQPIAPRLYIWDYTPNFAHYQQPFPNFDAIQANVQFFVKHSVKGLFEQGNYSSGGYGELGPLRAYLLAKLLWNPDTDVRKHTEEFLQAYYGKAADSMRAYVELLQTQVRQTGYHAHIYDPPTAAYLNDEFIAAAEGLFQKALGAADDEAVRLRVEVARLPIVYVKLATNRIPENERKAAIEGFLGVARKAGIDRISEGQSLDDWASRVLGP